MYRRQVRQLAPRVRQVLLQAQTKAPVLIVPQDTHLPIRGNLRARLAQQALLATRSLHLRAATVSLERLVRTQHQQRAKPAALVPIPQMGRAPA